MVCSVTVRYPLNDRVELMREWTEEKHLIELMTEDDLLCYKNEWAIYELDSRLLLGVPTDIKKPQIIDYTFLVRE